MKKDKVTDLVFVLDRSGSMAGLEKEVINGFNKIIEERRENEGKVKVTTVLFDNEPECIHKRVRENDKWNFLFLGANIDSISEAENLGISKSCACDFVANEEGLDVTYNALSDAVAGFCDLSSIDFSEAFGDEWKKSIEEFNELEDIVTKQMEELDFEETLE